MRTLLQRALEPAWEVGVDPCVVRAQPKYSMQPAPSTISASTVANAPTKPGSTCKRFRAQILSVGAATGGLAGGFEGAGAAAQNEGKRPGPWLWQEWHWGAAAAEGGRHLNLLEGT